MAQEYKLTPDLWAVGCIYAELLSLRPIFKGEEAKLDSKKTLPFQRDQMAKICDVLGAVKREFPGLCPFPLSFSVLPPSASSTRPPLVL